ncbi:Protein of unknown function, partial [Gryllus bimaculatus]
IAPLCCSLCGAVLSAGRLLLDERAVLRHRASLQHLPAASGQQRGRRLPPLAAVLAVRVGRPRPYCRRLRLPQFRQGPLAGGAAPRHRPAGLLVQEGEYGACLLLWACAVPAAGQRGDVLVHGDAVADGAARHGASQERGGAADGWRPAEAPRAAAAVRQAVLADGRDVAAGGGGVGGGRWPHHRLRRGLAQRAARRGRVRRVLLQARGAALPAPAPLRVAAVRAPTAHARARPVLHRHHHAQRLHTSLHTHAALRQPLRALSALLCPSLRNLVFRKRGN